MVHFCQMSLDLGRYAASLHTTIAFTTSYIQRLHFTVPRVRPHYLGVQLVSDEDDDRHHVRRVMSEDDDDDDEVDEDPEDDEVWEDPTGGTLTRLFNLASDGKLDDLAVLLQGLDTSTVNLQGVHLVGLALMF